jgi:ABC-type transporter Mla subunit MlaD
MNKEEFEAALSAATTPLAEELKNLQSTLASLGEEKKALEAAKDEAEQAKAALEETNASLTKEKADLETALEEAKNKAESVQSAFDAEIQKVLTAAGLSDTVPAELDAKLELLKKSHLTLANIPVEGVADRSDKVKNKSEKVDFSEFKVKKEN